MVSWYSRRLGAWRCVGSSARRHAQDVTISREADGWYVCISCADVPDSRLPPTGQETGIDLGLESFATLSDGTHLHTRLVSQGGTRAENGPTAGVAPQEGEQPQSQSGQTARQGAPDGAAPTAGLSAQDGARIGASKRHDLSRGFAGGQHGQEPPSRQEHQRCRVERRS